MVAIVKSYGMKGRQLSDIIDRRKLFEQVAAHLEASILSGDLKPGDRLPTERELQTTYGVGRPAVREALITLQRSGLIEIANGAPARVAMPTASVVLGNAMPAERLYDLGVISRVADLESLEDAVHPLVERLAANAPMSMRTMKDILVRLTDHAMTLPHDDIDQVARNVYASRDAIEGVAARVEKRQPVFRGE